MVGMIAGLLLLMYLKYHFCGNFKFGGCGYNRRA